MPRRIKSLKDATLFAIAKNIKYWSAMLPENPDSYLYLLSPFDILDHGLTQEVFDALVRYGSFLPIHIHLIFHSNLASIDLSKSVNFKLGDNVLRTLLKRSKKIKSLRISGGTRYSKTLMNMIPNQYPGLQNIALTHESMSEEFISNLASKCQQLVAFHSSSCTKLPASSFRMIAELEKICVLTLGNADTLSDEMLLLVLKKCRKLCHLSLPMSKMSFGLLDGEVFTSVQSLDLTLCDTVDDASVKNLCCSFKCLKELCLSNCSHITSKSLQIISKHCKQLENFNMSYTGIKKYNDDVINFLMEIGHNLHSIDFSGISHISTAIFGEYCSHLERLCLNHCPYMATEWIPYKVLVTVIERNAKHNDRFLNDLVHQLGKRGKYSLTELCPTLKTLQLDLRKKGSNVSDYDIDSVLYGGRSLEMLSLVEMPLFTDNDIKSLEACMNTASIMHLNLSGNLSVTMEGAWYAIEHMTNLQILEIRDCDVLKNEFDELQNRIMRKGYDIELVGHKVK